MKLTRAAASKRIEKLRQQINNYRYHYHILNESIMSEEAADSLKHELTRLEDQYPELVTPDSPTQRVAGQPSAGFTKVEHSERMLSLNDVFDDKELEAWLTRIQKLVPEWHPEFFVDIKMDGLACALIYDDGVLVRAVTRGDGFVGEDVTHNVRTIHSVPLKLHGKYPKHIEVRGEIVMYKTDFVKLNEDRRKNGLDEFKNPRNLAAGTIRQLDPALTATRPLQFHAYNLMYAGTTTRSQEYDHLRKLGFIANRQAKRFESIQEVIQFANTWETKRHSLPFNTDGLVIKVNDLDTYQQLGIVGKAPRAAVAYKYAAEEATSRIRDIIISIGRTGAATPVALLEPVNIAGTTVQHASLHNADEIARKDIRIGDTVIIHKAGDIIPQVVRVLTDLREGHEEPFDMEKALEQHELEFVRPEGEAVWRAVSKDSPDIIKRTIQHFASKAALDIDGLGKKNVDLLVDKSLVHDAADLFTLKKSDLLQLERFAEISANNLIAAIADKKAPPFARFLYGLGIRHVGVQTALDLAGRFPTLTDLAHADYDTLEEIDGIGEVVTHSILEWFADEDNQRLLNKFHDVGVTPKNDTITEGGHLVGQSFAITGTLESMGRNEAAEQIRSFGGTFQSSVGKGTTYLVVGANAGSSKAEKARKLGTKVIDEQQLLALINI